MEERVCVDNPPLSAWTSRQSYSNPRRSIWFAFSSDWLVCLRDLFGKQLPCSMFRSNAWFRPALRGKLVVLSSCDGDVARRAGGVHAGRKPTGSGSGAKCS